MKHIKLIMNAVALFQNSYIQLKCILYVTWQSYFIIA